MAVSLEQLRNTIMTSLFGRRLGFDNNEFLVGTKDLRVAIEDISTTAATSALPYGHTRVLTSGSSQTGTYTLQAPVPGVRKTLSLNSTSTGTMQFTATNAAFLSGSGTSEAVISLITKGAFVELLGVTTAYWQILSGSSIIPTNVLYTTST
jgi:hypothetical protein